MAYAITACPQCGLEYEGGEVFCPIDGARLSPKQDGHASAPPREPADPLIGTTLSGRYRIIRKIGEGGMGIVYEAEHVLIEKRVGLKVLREDFSSRLDVVERFRQEAKSASKIGHEHIIDISDFGVTQSGANFFVMELLHGRDLATELERRGPLSPRRTLHIALQCAEALGAAHGKGIIHRDMKPENIFLLDRKNEEDFVKIVDFGIAKMSDVETTGQPGRKLTKTGMIFGTPEYMSPEQAGGKQLDHRVDIYALGIIMYELLTGRVPFQGDTFMGILTQHMFEQVPPLRSMHPGCNAPAEVERIVFRALAKNPTERFQSMAELAAELSGALTRTPNSISSLAPPPGTITHVGVDHEPLGAPRAPRLLPAGQASEFPPQKAPQPKLWLAVGALSVLVLGGAGYWLTREKPVAEQPRIAPLPQESSSTALVAPSPPSAPAEPAAVEPVRSERVLLEVSTQPAGASVNIDGKLGCEPTPCTVSAMRDALVKLEAQLAGYRSSSTELRADEDQKSVQLTLKRKSSGGRSEPNPDGELLIPDAFARPRRR